MNSAPNNTIGTTEVLLETDTLRITQSACGGFTQINARVIRLKPQEAKLLKILSAGKGTVLTERMIMHKLYPFEKAVGLKIIDIVVCTLRKKLKKISPEAAQALRTVWGRGYALGTPTDAVATEPPYPLPDPTARWTVARKSLVLDALRAKHLSVSDVLAYYTDLSEDELIEWDWKYEQYGRRGLKCTQAVAYHPQLESV